MPLKNRGRVFHREAWSRALNLARGLHRERHMDVTAASRPEGGVPAGSLEGARTAGGVLTIWRAWGKALDQLSAAVSMKPRINCGDPAAPGHCPTDIGFGPGAQ
jgi:hypothetical protein